VSVTPLQRPERASGAADPVGAAERLAPRLAALGDRIERERRLPPELLAELHEARLFRLLLPRSLGGLETDPLTLFRTIEAIAKADASTAWCLGQAAGCALAAAYLEPAVAREIFGPADAVLAWGPPTKPPRAVMVEGGFRVSGSWSFLSGGRHASWVGAHCLLFAADGTALAEPDGKPTERTMLLRADSVTWSDIWSVIGLRGTASDAFAVTDRYVPTAYSVRRDFAPERREVGPLYRMTTLALFPVAFAAVAQGIARSVLDSFLALGRKVPRGVKHALRDNHAVQSDLAQAEAGLQAARRHLLHEVAQIWAALEAGGEFTLDQRMTIRLAATHAIHQARAAVDFAYHAAGATAIFASHPMERRFRDMHTLTQQVQARRANFETVGAYLLGAEPDLTFV
jgi:alkylation response protein AidB-like acyl-CoA dehydrogenase